MECPGDPGTQQPELGIFQQEMQREEFDRTWPERQKTGDGAKDFGV